MLARRSGPGRLSSVCDLLLNGSTTRPQENSWRARWPPSRTGAGTSALHAEFVSCRGVVDNGRRLVAATRSSLACQASEVGGLAIHLRGAELTLNAITVDNLRLACHPKLARRASEGWGTRPGSNR